MGPKPWLFFRVMATLRAASTEGVIDSVRSDQARTSCQSDSDFLPMRWQLIAEESACKYEQQTGGHQDKN
jgi:hypothetical protein